ncbi:hypothetical protein E2C01_082919 [Portunus trituberculatus]|uniref:Uncharacterized protein n=1 Tax=Portunus trituberculatus TaxID=210409 RepID=A0A5B7ITJ6_PORTR|nr:hypothetical protein [Portunus trituberculatus]
MSLHLPLGLYSHPGVLNHAFGYSWSSLGLSARLSVPMQLLGSSQTHTPGTLARLGPQAMTERVVN